MQTKFAPQERASREGAGAENIVRTCVHCGFCTATCPTYVLLGDELDSPRGRIYLMKEMLEKGGAPSASTVKHVDRCLSCLSCMTTCPSGVHYMHLVDHARAYIEENYQRPWHDRLLRQMLVTVLTNRAVFRAALGFAGIGRLFAPLLPAQLKAMTAMAPKQAVGRDPAESARVFKAQGEKRGRVALLAGCAQPVIAPEINAAAIRLLNRLGVEVVTADGAGCCGALPHHLGKAERSHALAKANIAAWMREIEGDGLDAIVITTSGCGTTVKDYGHMFAGDPEWAEKAARVAALTKDVSEVLTKFAPEQDLPKAGMKVAYHAACSLQHGQSIREAPKNLLLRAGFEVVEPAEGHLCCGSAGVYNVLQPDIAQRLRDRKASALEATRPDVIAAGNVGCMKQIGGGSSLPIVHTVELLDWRLGGEMPAALRGRKAPS